MQKAKRITMGIVAKRFGRGFGEQSSYLRGLALIGRRHGVRVFVFQPHRINFLNNTIKGWSLYGHTWKRSTFSFPDVVYNRVWGVSKVGKQQLDRDLEILRADHKVPTFNPLFGNKLDIHDMLSTSKEVVPHLPQTMPLTPENVEELGNTERLLYAKPILGRQGKGISVCIKTNNGWRVRRRLNTGAVRTFFARSPSDIASHCAGRNKAEAFLIQQGLKLVKVRGGTVDIRVIAQRDDKGVWSVTGIGVRVGAPGSFVSNLHAGGRAYTLSGLAKAAHLKTTSGKLANEIKQLVLDVVNHLTKYFPTLGEVGVDIGLDTTGRLWILEVNRQPGRSLFVRAKLYRSWRRSRLRIIQFARYIAHESKKEGLPDYAIRPEIPYDDSREVKAP